MQYAHDKIGEPISVDLLKEIISHECMYKNIELNNDTIRVFCPRKFFQTKKWR